MPVYAQAPDYQVDPVGDFLGAFQQTQNLFQQKQKLAMEKERNALVMSKTRMEMDHAETQNQVNLMKIQNYEEDRKHKMELQKVQIDTANKSLEIAGNKLRDDKAMRERAGEDLPRFVSEYSGVGSQIDNIPQDADLRTLTRRISTLQSRMSQLDAMSQHVASSPQYASQLMFARDQISAKLSALSAGIAGKVGEAKDSFTSEVQALGDPTDDPEELNVYGEKLRQIEATYSLLQGHDPLKTYTTKMDKLNTAYEAKRNEVSKRAHEKEIEKIKAQNAINKENNKETTIKAGMENTTRRNNAVSSTKVLFKKKTDVQRLMKNLPETGGWKARGIEVLNSIFGVNWEYAKVKELSTDEWLDKTSKLKGALSDAEGNRIDLAIPDIRKNEEVWEEFLMNLEKRLDTEINNNRVWLEKWAPDRLGDAGFGEQKPEKQNDKDGGGANNLK